VNFRRQPACFSQFGTCRSAPPPKLFPLFPHSANIPRASATQLRLQPLCFQLLPHSFRHHGVGVSPRHCRVQIPQTKPSPYSPATYGFPVRHPLTTISRLFTLFRTLLHFAKSYRPRFQANPNSLRKTPGVGVSPFVTSLLPYILTSFGNEAINRPRHRARKAATQ